MKELKYIEKILNNAIQKGVFTTMQEANEAIQCLDTIFKKINSLEQRVKTLEEQQPQPHNSQR
jgi:hypothetical protein